MKLLSSVFNQRRMISVIVSLFGILLFFGCNKPDTKLRFNDTSELADQIEQIVLEAGLPSLQVALISEDEIAWSQCFGKGANLQQVYMIGSVQKVFDATALLQLSEKGLIDLDADINTYLPFSIRHVDYPDQSITIRMLATHKSGLDNFRYHFAWETECMAYPKYRSTCNEELLSLKSDAYLKESLQEDGLNYCPEAWQSKPGEEYNYSVTGYLILKYLISQVANQSYVEYMKGNIFDPLEMDNAGFYLSEFEGRHAIPYTFLSGEYEEMPLWNGNGDLMRMTAVDLAKFQIALMNDGRYQEVQLLQPETVELMRKVTTHRNSFFNRISKFFNSGRGISIQHFKGGWMGYGGSVPGYICLWRFNPDAQAGYSFLINANSIVMNTDDLKLITAAYTRLQKIIENRMVPTSIFKSKRFAFPLLIAITIIIISNIVYRKKRLQKGHNKV